VIDIKVNEQQTLAWLKVNMDSPRFPDIHLDLLLKRNFNSQWKGVDFRFKGITYVNLKKNSYRQDFKDLRFKGLLKKIDDKNNLFFRDLCQNKANYIDPKKPPCLQNYDKK
jgi:ABC-type transporter MlaC component